MLVPFRGCLLVCERFVTSGLTHSGPRQYGIGLSSGRYAFSAFIRLAGPKDYGNNMVQAQRP
nr:hypothetical protein [Tanacetum cinerariifolium]